MNYSRESLPGQEIFFVEDYTVIKYSSFQVLQKNTQPQPNHKSYYSSTRLRRIRWADSPIWFKPKWESWCKSFLLNIVAEGNNNNSLTAAEKHWIFVMFSFWSVLSNSFHPRKFPFLRCYFLPQINDKSSTGKVTTSVSHKSALYTLSFTLVVLGPVECWAGAPKAENFFYQDPQLSWPPSFQIVFFF